MRLVSLAEIEAAAERVAGTVVETPLVRLTGTNVWIKCEVGAADWELQAAGGLQHDCAVEPGSTLGVG